MTVARRLRILNGGDRKTAHEARQTNSGVRIAFATSDLKQVDQHFGTAESFAIYSIDPVRIHLDEVVQFGQLDRDGNEDKLAAKIDALKDCLAVYCQAIGASAVNQLRPLGIQPIKVAAGTPLTQTLRTLQAALRDGSSAWLARAIAQRQAERENRFDAMAAEGWRE